MLIITLVRQSILLLTLILITLIKCPALESGRVAVVTGASRGIGRGIALELGKAGFVVYALARSSREKKQFSLKDQRVVAEGLDLTVEGTAERITALGGRGYGISIDLTEKGALGNFLASMSENRLDVLVCSAYTTPPGKLRGEFWTQGMEMWEAVNDLGLNCVYDACCTAAPYMIDTAKHSSHAPLICLVSSFGGKSYTFNAAYGVGKSAIDRLAVDMSYQLKKYGVATTSIYPGLVKTEANMQMVVDGTWGEASGNLDITKGETPAFSGKAVVALTALEKNSMMERTGRVEVVAELADEFGFLDEDDSKPPSIRSLQYLLPNFVFPTVEKNNNVKVPNWIKNNVPNILVPWSTFSSGPPPDMDNR